MKIEKFLPVGSVVLLKGAQKKIMIIGFCPVPKNDEKKIFDYSGCLYPEGLISSDKTLLFNHDQIEKIYHLGLIDEEEQTFKEKLIEVIKEEKTKNKKNN